MRMLYQIKHILVIIALMIGLAAQCVYAEIDRSQLVTKQIELLKNRYQDAEREYNELQSQPDAPLSSNSMEKASKSLLDKAALDISVAKSNLDSINIELADSQQTIIWLGKNEREIENQLNVLSIFGTKMAQAGVADVSQLRADLQYQKELSEKEKARASYLQKLQIVANNVLQLRKEKYTRLDATLKSHQLQLIKQQQVKDQLTYQELQNHWLQQLTVLYAKLSKLDPAESRSEYSAIERDIYYANENANYAYVQSLLARYKDQLEQMNLSVLKSGSISLLNEIGDQSQLLARQVTKLDNALQSRMTVLGNHISYLSKRASLSPDRQAYIDRLSAMQREYEATHQGLLSLNTHLQKFRKTLDQAIQKELSARQGFPSFGYRTWLEVGKEMLLVPALSFQIAKNMTSYLVKAYHSTSWVAWLIFALVEVLVVSFAAYLKVKLRQILSRPSNRGEQISTQWLMLELLSRNFIDVAFILNAIGMALFFGIPLRNFMVVVSLMTVWLCFKAIMTVARLCLIETTLNTEGHDARLFYRLQKIIWVGGVITAVAVFVHQLPLIYELKILCERLFLLFLVVGSALVLRSWNVLPNLIITHIDASHPYVQKCIRLMGVLIPALMLLNSLIGLFGFLNLVMTISWYEGIFLLVLVGYLFLRGLLSDGMELLSSLVIQYTKNGWLWTEAFLKPLDKILRIVLLLLSGAVLFLLYGWDQQTPIVERFIRLFHYPLIHVASTTITPLNIMALIAVISVFYWTAKWTREFVYRLLSKRTSDLGIRNSIAIISQYSVVVLGALLCLKVLGIDFSALAVVASMFALGIGLGLRDLVNNFACGFLILLERPLRVGDIVSIDGVDGEVTHIGGRAVTVRTWDHMELVVPNTEIFNKTFTNWTAKDNTVRTIVPIKISRYDNPHEVAGIITAVLAKYHEVLKDPVPEVFLKDMSDTLMEFEVRYFVNIRQVKSRISVASAVLMNIWDAFALHGIKPPYPHQEIILKSETSLMPPVLLQPSS